MVEFSFLARDIPFHKEHKLVTTEKENVSKKYSEMILRSRRIKPPSVISKLYALYKSSYCKLCGKGVNVDNSTNFFYHTLSEKHKERALPYVSKEDLEFWNRLLEGCGPLRPKTQSKVQVARHIPFHSINARKNQEDRIFINNHIDKIVFKCNLNITKYLNSHKMTLFYSLIDDKMQFCKLCSSKKNIAGSNSLSHTFCQTHINRVKEECNSSLHDIVFWYLCFDWDLTELIEAYNDHRLTRFGDSGFAEKMAQFENHPVQDLWQRVSVNYLKAAQPVARAIKRELSPPGTQRVTRTDDSLIEQYAHRSLTPIPPATHRSSSSSGEAYVEMHTDMPGSDQCYNMTCIPESFPLYLGYEALVYNGKRTGEDELVSVMLLQLKILLSEVGSRTLNREVKFKEAMCRYCKVLCDSVHSYLHHLVSDMHRIYLVCYDIKLQPEVLHFWERVLLRIRNS